MVKAYLDWKLGPERYNEDYELLAEFIRHFELKPHEDPNALLKTVFMSYAETKKSQSCYHSLVC
jgi:hypothetical protein